MSVKNSNTPVSTAATKIDVPLGMLPRLGMAYLHNIGSIVLHNSLEQEVKRTISGIDLLSTSSFRLRTTLGDVVDVSNAVSGSVTFSGQSAMAVCAACSHCASFSVAETPETLAIRDQYSADALALLQAGAEPACVGKIAGAVSHGMRTLGDPRGFHELQTGTNPLQCITGTTANSANTVVATGVVQYGRPTANGTSSSGPTWTTLGTGITCVANQRDVITEQGIDQATCQLRCEERTWCNYISLVRPEPNDGLICWLESDCQSQQANTAASEASAHQLQFAGLHPAVINDLRRYTKDVVGTALGLAVAGLMADVTTMVETSGEAPMLNYTVTLRGANAQLASSEGAAKINQRFVADPHETFYPIAPVLDTWAGVTVNADARAKARQDATNAPAQSTGGGAGGGNNAQQRRAVPRSRSPHVLSDGSPHYNPPPRGVHSRRGRPAGWESGLVDGEVQDAMPAHAWTAVHVDLNDDVTHVPGHAKHYGGVKCEGLDTISMSKGVEQMVGGIGVGSILWGTGCEDWGHQMFARRVLHIRPHVEHPNATVVAAVEPYPMMKAIGRYHFETYIPPADANDTVRADLDHHAHATFSTWRKSAGRHRRRVTEVHDMVMHHEQYIRRRQARGLGEKWPVNIAKTWSIGFPGIRMRSAAQAIYENSPAEAQQWMDMGTGSFAWPSGIFVALQGVPPTVWLTDVSTSKFSLGLYIHGKGGAKFSCRSCWCWPPVKCSINKYGKMRYELKGDVTFRLGPRFENVGPFELKLGWGIDKNLQIFAAIGLGLHFEFGIFFSATQATRLYLGGLQIDYAVRLGKEIVCNEGCRTTNINSKSGKLTFFGPYGEVPNEPVSVSVGPFFGITGSICFPMCADQASVTIARASVGVELKLYGNMDLIPDCPNPTRTWVDQLGVPVTWCFWGCNMAAVTGAIRCVAKWSGRSNTGCLARKLVNKCPTFNTAGCERCPSGARCDKDSAGDCREFGDGYHCNVGRWSSTRCPSGQNCWYYRGVRYFTIPAPFPCNGAGSTAKPYISFKIDVEIYLELWVGVEINTPIGGVSIGLTYKPVAWIFNLYQSAIWEPKFLQRSTKVYWFDRQAKALSGPTVGTGINQSGSVAFPGAQPGSVSGPNGVVLASQLQDIVGAWFFNVPDADDPPSGLAVTIGLETATANYSLATGTMTVVDDMEAYNDSMPLDVDMMGNTGENGTLQSAAVIALRPAHTYTLQFPAAASGNKPKIVTRVPVPAEHAALLIKLVPLGPEPVDGSLFDTIRDEQPAADVHCHYGVPDWQWNISERRWQFPAPAAGLGCPLYCHPSTGGCIFSLPASKTSMHWYMILDGAHGAQVTAQIWHVARITPGKSVPMEPDYGFGALVDCAAPPNFFVTKNATAADAAAAALPPKVTFSLAVTRPNTANGTLIGIPATQRDMRDCISTDNSSNPCPAFSFDGWCSVAGQLESPLGSPSGSKVEPSVKALVSSPTRFTLMCDMAVSAADSPATHIGPVQLSPDEEVSFVITGPELTAASAGGQMGVCVRLNVTDPSKLEMFVKQDGRFSPDAVRAAPVCQSGGVDSVRTGMTEVEPELPLWLAADVVGSGMSVRTLILNEQGPEEPDDPPPPPLRVALESGAPNTPGTGNPLLLAHKARTVVAAIPSSLNCDLNPAKIVVELNCGTWPPADVVPPEKFLSDLIAMQTDPIAKASLSAVRVLSPSALLVTLVVPDPTGTTSGVAAGTSATLNFLLPTESANVFGNDAFSTRLQVTKGNGRCSSGVALKFGA
eukprot:TRINITY_DN15548_c3_g1_i1.p1 TRINITY_DN15548_c3_g1~~TRINITY_DN15548_c3_g1_i1.p1  ORF type:complete len:1979 (+),score=547.71 TRINITY_DN15548_c3_g1_i1:653-5938(+)